MAIQRVRRVVRKIDPWTVLKVSFVFNAVMALVFVLGTIIFWSIFVNAGLPERIDELALLIGLENGINLDGQVYFRVVTLLSVVGTILMTGFFTLGAVMYNLISDLVGGIELIVLEETAVPHATKPEVKLPVGNDKRSRGAVLPSVKPLVRKPPDETKEQPRPAEVEKTG